MINQPVVAESYDELVFTNPKDDFFRALMAYKKTQGKMKITGHSKDFYTVFEDRGDIQQLAFIGDHIAREMEGIDFECSMVLLPILLTYFLYIVSDFFCQLPKPDYCNWKTSCIIFKM